jgi:hypothetical protein
LWERGDLETGRLFHFSSASLRFLPSLLTPDWHLNHSRASPIENQNSKIENRLIPFVSPPKMFPMGRSYWFECSRCAYRTKVSGCADRGHDFFIQTISCRECKQLYDAVVRMRLPLPSTMGFGLNSNGSARPHQVKHIHLRSGPPVFEAVLNRLPHTEIRRFRWLNFKPQCPVTPFHHVEPWNDPGMCPRCGLHLEKSALPFRRWD